MQFTQSPWHLAQATRNVKIAQTLHLSYCLIWFVFVSLMWYCAVLNA